MREVSRVTPVRLRGFKTHHRNFLSDREIGNEDSTDPLD